jgi:hypothetical protein
MTEVQQMTGKAFSQMTNLQLEIAMVYAHSVGNRQHMLEIREEQRKRRAARWN